MKGVENLGNKKRRNLTLVAAAAVLLTFGMLSFLCAGISVKAEFMGTSLGLSIPVISASSLMGIVANGGLVNFLFIAYIVLTVAAVLMSFLAVFMIIIRNRKGVVAGLLSTGISAVMSIVMIIAVFVANSKYGSSAMSFVPSAWMWISVPVNLLGAVFLFIEGDDIV